MTFEEVDVFVDWINEKAAEQKRAQRRR